MGEDRQDISDRNVRDLWTRGKFWEIFGFSSGDFTTLELAKQYSALTKAYQDDPEVRKIIDETFAVLNAPLTRQFYEGCRELMRRIRRESGGTISRDIEHGIWRSLWNWVSERWQEPPEELINSIKNRYLLPEGTDVIEIPQTWSDEGLKPADLDSILDSTRAAKAFAKETKCQSCGKFDHTLRIVTFPYVISIIIVAFKRFSEAGIFCYECRRAKSLKWGIISLLFGWWSIWGFFWNISALVDNYRGGKILSEYNDPFVAQLAWAHMILGKIAEAKACLAKPLKCEFSKEASQLKKELDTRYAQISPAKIGKFRLGYLTIVFAVLGAYTIGGMALFGWTPSPQIYTLTTNVIPSGAGWVSTSGGEYESGAQVVLIANAASGYIFDHWSGSASGTTSSILITMNLDRSVTANFKAIQTTLGVLFSDDFSDEAGVWDTYSDEYGSVFYEDGWLHLTNNNPAQFITGTWANQHFTDFTLELETKLVGGTDNNWHMVICRYQDSDNFYSFRTSGDGYYSMSKMVNGNWIALASVAYSSYINRGVEAVNLIHIECIDSNLSLSVNGHLLWEGVDATFADGDVVLATEALAGTFTEVAFDNIVVSEP